MKYKSYAVLPILFLLIQSCGGDRPTSASSKQVSETQEVAPVPVVSDDVERDVISDLQVRLVPGAQAEAELAEATVALESVSTPAVESPSSENSNRTTRDERGVLFHDKVFLPDLASPIPELRKNWFFVWPERVGNLQVVSARYTHRILNGQNEIFGNLNSQRARHDIENHRWFIPITELFRNQTYLQHYEAHLEDMQVLDLEIQLENQRTVRMDLRFQATEPLPVMEIMNQSLPNQTFNREWSFESAQNGRTIKSETFINPSRLPLQVWLHVDSRRGLQFQTYLNYQIYFPQDHSPPSGPHYEYYLSEAPLEVFQVELIRNQQQIEERALGALEWISFPLAPLETVTLRWKARPPLHISRCSLPQRQDVSFSWSELPPSRPVQVEPPRISSPHTSAPTHPFINNLVALVEQPRQLPTPRLNPPRVRTVLRSHEWNVHAARLMGNWLREIRISFPSIPERDATVDANTPGGSVLPGVYRILETGNVMTEMRRGIIPLATIQRMECQGVFLR